MLWETYLNVSICYDGGDDDDDDDDDDGGGGDNLNWCI